MTTPAARGRRATAAAPPLAEALHAVAIHLLRRVRTADRASGLSAPRLSALSVLVFGGPRSLGALARAEQVSAATMSRLVAGLVRQRYIRRIRDPDDARAVILSPTPAAVRLLRTGRTRRVRAVAALLDECTDAERRAIARAVRALDRSLGAIRPP